MSKSDDKLLTSTAAAQAINRTSQTLAGWRTVGLGPGYEKIGQRVYYRASTVEAWLASQTKTVEHGTEPIPRRRKSFVGSSNTPEIVAEPESVEVVAIRGGLDGGPHLWEPVDVATLTVLEMLAKYDDVIAVTSGPHQGTYGVARHRADQLAAPR